MEANTTHEDKGTNETTYETMGKHLGLYFKRRKGEQKRKALIRGKTSMGYEPKITNSCF